MKNDRTKTIFYLDRKHVHKYIVLQNSAQCDFFFTIKATESPESVAEKKKLASPQGIPSEDRMPQL